MRAALIRGGVVESVILVGKNYDPPEGFDYEELTDDEVVGPGFTRGGSGWSAPEVPGPELSGPEPTVADLMERQEQQQQFLDELAAIILGGMEL